MDALKIEKAIFGGFDWGARTANIIAALWPERCKAMVSVSGYLIGSQEAGKAPLPPKAELHGGISSISPRSAASAGYERIPPRLQQADLAARVAEMEFRRCDVRALRRSRSTIPDHVAMVIHNYRWRLGLVKGEPQYDELEARLAARADHRRADHHDGRRRQRRAASGAGGLREEVHRQVCAPQHQRRHRSQPAAGSPQGICAGGDRSCKLLSVHVPNLKDRNPGSFSTDSGGGGHLTDAVPREPPAMLTSHSTHLMRIPSCIFY